jgi:MinD-like ATPase involved in chromosome partitioning or flagellar assembly
MSIGKKTCTIIGGNKGGVGKSMISMIKALVFEKAKYPLQVIEIDHQKRLSSLVGSGAVHKSIPANVDFEEIARDRHAAEKFYNAVYKEWMQSDSLTDLGANVTTPLLSWIRMNMITTLAAEDQIEFRFVAVASPDDEALRSAVSAIEEARAVLGPMAEYYVVLNDLNGSYGFAPYAANESVKTLEALEAKGQIEILRVSYCDSILFELGRARGINARKALDMAEDIGAAESLDDVTVRIHKMKLTKWLRDTQAVLRPILSVERAAA